MDIFFAGGGSWLNVNQIVKHCVTAEVGGMLRQTTPKTSAKMFSKPS